MNRNTIIEEDAKRIADAVDLSMLAEKDILVTGASGLIGSYLLYSLKECISRGIPIKKVHVVCKSTAPEHIQNILGSAWIQLWQGDLCNDFFRATIPKCDYIIHCAGYGQPSKFTVDEDKTIKLNTTVTFDLLDKLKASGKLMFISTSGIYNGLQKESFCESDVGTTNTLHPRACYIEGKRCGETICNAYRKKGINAVSARLSYVYGPGVRIGDKRALYAFIEKGLTGKIALLDDGSAERIYCYVADAVEILWNILLYGEEPIYNVGAKEKVTILDLAIKIGKMLNATVSVPQNSNTIPGNAKFERLNISKIEKEFGKYTFIPLDEGLERTIEWVKLQHQPEGLSRCTSFTCITD